MPSLDKKAILHLKQDPIMAKLIKRLDIMPLALSTDVYERLLKAIVFQQLSGKAATTIHNRFLEMFPEIYPDPERLLEFEIADLRAVGLSNQKANYVQNVASYFLENKLYRQDWHNYPDEEILKQLTTIKGVGTWTVQMILMFTLGRPDVLPTGDLVIQQAMQKLYQLDGKGKILSKKMEETSQLWQPYRSLACRYLWQWRDVE